MLQRYIIFYQKLFLMLKIQALLSLEIMENTVIKIKQKIHIAQNLKLRIVSITNIYMQISELRPFLKDKTILHITSRPSLLKYFHFTFVLQKYLFHLC